MVDAQSEDLTYGSTSLVLLILAGVTGVCWLISFHAVRSKPLSAMVAACGFRHRSAAAAAIDWIASLVDGNG